ncbi:DUF2971 domain-containing protein [Leisingera daeponensis]|uniref:DUF2971 domain-containing protein n=1 Tax=Leisingera daeponensis TaxID=405746 RepID=UPI000482BAAE|nr:DUF2971 domain-containing protein [Leisingera daeponensis]
MTVKINWLQREATDRRRLFYFTSPDHLLGNLRENKIKVSEFKKCNDVFELASVELKDKQTRADQQAWSEELSRELGLICFSQDWRNQLMWGHYSKSGKGVCLVVDVLVEELQRVKYLPRRKTSNGVPFPSSSDPAFRQFCSQKSHHWSYEKEERLFVDFRSKGVFSTKDGRFLQMGDEVQLVGFINGPQPEFSAKEIQKAYGRSLEHFQCRAAFRDFRMVVQQNKKLWKKVQP